MGRLACNRPIVASPRDSEIRSPEPGSRLVPRPFFSNTGIPVFKIVDKGNRGLWLGYDPTWIATQREDPSSFWTRYVLLTGQVRGKISPEVSF